MCEAICDVVEASLVERGMKVGSSKPLAARAMKQQRGRLHPQVVSEYNHVVSYVLPCLRSLDEQLTFSPLELAKVRLQRLATWRQWAAELKLEEDLTRAKMHPNVRKVLGLKRTVLLERVAESIGWRWAKQAPVAQIARKAVQ